MKSNALSPRWGEYGGDLPTWILFAIRNPQSEISNLKSQI
jgi:hypothetical protein